MEKAEGGTWFKEVEGNIKNSLYTYKILRNGKIVETVDPYAKALTANGTHGVVVDLRDTNPAGWEKDTKPFFENPVDAIIYELHVRDFSIHKESGIKNKGKYLAFTENGTRYGEIKTGLDHLVELGITHLHLLPIQDFASVDETTGGYNWGYDPYHYFVPEGSYSQNPSDPVARIREVKEMILSLHKTGIRVILDVVYNHTYTTGDSILDKVEPGYFYRLKKDGTYSNGSGCGNETASERPMMKKLMIDSLKYWVKEYHVDGFRFDLMGLHDVDTMKEIEEELHKQDPTLLLYG
ncbi:MAG: alpha-amylase family glycosyl hydrolase, partial [Caldanaerobacter sp.]